IWKSHPANTPNEVWGLDMVLEDPQGNLVQAIANINKFQLLTKNTSVTTVASFDNNTRGFKFDPFSNFTARTFGETKVVGKPSVSNFIRSTKLYINANIPEIAAFRLRCHQKMVGMIRDSENKCERIAKEVDEAEAASIPRNSWRLTLWNCKLHKAITVVGIMYV
nr:replication protein A 70 kDa DNA-binding subunit B [Tanacetum cinerariifolium]